MLSKLGIAPRRLRDVGDAGGALDIGDALAQVRELSFEPQDARIGRLLVARSLIGEIPDDAAQLSLP